MTNATDKAQSSQSVGLHAISIVAPVYNEDENLRPLVAEVDAALADSGIEYEIILVDDGSKDDSLAVIRELAVENPRVRYLAFAANCGQSAAFTAGFRSARNPWVVTMDSDLQNDPADIPRMLEMLDQGYDMVIGWRIKRRDSFMKRIASKVGNAVRNRLTRETVRDTGCSLKVMRAEMARCLPMFTGMHRFLPTLMKMQGARVAETQVNHRPRGYGVSKYGTIDRAIQGGHDLLAVRWMQSRAFRYEIKEEK